MLPHFCFSFPCLNFIFLAFDFKKKFKYAKQKVWHNRLNHHRWHSIWALFQVLDSPLPTYFRRQWNMAQVLGPLLLIRIPCWSSRLLTLAWSRLCVMGIWDQPMSLSAFQINWRYIYVLRGFQESSSWQPQFKRCFYLSLCCIWLWVSDVAHQYTSTLGVCWCVSLHKGTSCVHMCPLLWGGPFHPPAVTQCFTTNPEVVLASMGQG